MPVKLETVIERDFDETFITKMRNRVGTSGFKYGPVEEWSKQYSAIATTFLEILSYLETGNKEYLVNAANYIMFEYDYPSSRPDAHFTPSDSDKSAGQVLRYVWPQLNGKEWTRHEHTATDTDEETRIVGGDRIEGRRTRKQNKARRPKHG